MKKGTIYSQIKHVKSICEKIRRSQELILVDNLEIERINQAVAKINYREREFPPDVTILAFLSQVMEEDQSCQKAVAKVIANLVRQGKKSPSANTAAYCKARARLPKELLSELSKSVVSDQEESVDSKWLWRGRHLKIPDGTTVSMPDTKRNREVFPQPDSQKEGVGFPLARMLGVFSLATGALLDIEMGAYGGKGTGEHSLLWKLKDTFKEGDVMLGDACYGSFFFDCANDVERSRCSCSKT